MSMTEQDEFPQYALRHSIDAQDLGE